MLIKDETTQPDHKPQVRQSLNWWKYLKQWQLNHPYKPERVHTARPIFLSLISERNGYRTQCNFHPKENRNQNQISVLLSAYYLKPIKSERKSESETKNRTGSVNRSWACTKVQTKQTDYETVKSFSLRACSVESVSVIPRGFVDIWWGFPSLILPLTCCAPAHQMLHILSVLMGSVRGGIREGNPHQMSTKPRRITEADWTEHARKLKDLTHSLIIELRTSKTSANSS